MRPTGPPARSPICRFDFAATASIVEVVVAEDRGYFEDLCLDVELQPSTSTANYPIVAAGAPSSPPVVFSEVVNFAAANEADLVAVTVAGRSAIDSLILKPGVAERLEDLAGTTIGVKLGKSRRASPRCSPWWAWSRGRTTPPCSSTGSTRWSTSSCRGSSGSLGTRATSRAARARRRRLRPLRPVGPRDPRFLGVLSPPASSSTTSDRRPGLPPGGDARARRRPRRSGGGRGAGGEPAEAGGNPTSCRSRGRPSAGPPTSS